MAEVTVFIDDAVRGALPAICVKEGVPTEDRLTIREQSQSAGLGAAWLLLFFGPLGWLVLFLISVTRRPGDFVTARVPFCEFAFRRLRVARRMRLAWGGATIVLLILALAAAVIHGSASLPAAIALGAGAIAALVMTVRESSRYNHARVGLALDASRRWLTLSGVHPDFALAVDRESADRDRHSISRP
jgi:hypothetical protein